METFMTLLGFCSLLVFVPLALHGVLGQLAHEYLPDGHRLARPLAVSDKVMLLEIMFIMISACGLAVAQAWALWGGAACP